MKYRLTENFKVNIFGAKLFQIECTTAIESKGVQVGNLGGYIEAEKNLSQEGNAWVYGDAWVSGDAEVYGDAGERQVRTNGFDQIACAAGE